MPQLLWKEFRETVRWIPLFMILTIAMFWTALPSKTGIAVTDLPVRIGFAIAVSGLFTATGLALFQFAMDQRESARGFLLHRGVSFDQIYYAKLAVGATLYLFSVMVPLGCVAAYLESEGLEHLPTAAYQTVPALVAGLYHFVFYFATVVVLCRPVRWFGSKLLPVLPALAIGLCSLSMSSNYVLETAMALGLGLAGWLAMYIWSRTSFVNDTRKPLPSAGWTMSYLHKGLLLVSCVVLPLAVINIPALILFANNNWYMEIQLDSNREPWLLTGEGGNPNSAIRGVKLTPNGIPSPIQSIGGRDRYTRTIEMLGHSQPRHWDIRYDTNSEYIFTDESPTGNFYPYSLSFFVEPSGRVLCYIHPRNTLGHIEESKLFRVIEKDAVGHVANSTGKPFSNPRCNLREYDGFNKKNSMIVYDDHGAYLVDLDNEQITQIINQPVEMRSETISMYDNRSVTRLFLKSGHEISIYDQTVLKDATANKDFKLVTKFTDTATTSNSRQSFSYLDSDDWLLVTRYHNYAYHVDRCRGGKTESYDVDIPTELLWSQSNKSAYTLATIPPAFYVAVFGMTWIRDPSARGEVVYEYYHSRSVVVVGICVCIASMIGTYFAARRRELSMRSRLTWSILALFTGVGTILAVFAIYPEIIRERCSKCDALRRVDMDVCEHCHSTWEPPIADGIEIVEDTTAVAMHSTLVNT